ncbi:hypothetical protein HanXRQr2_Chr05g0231341 [Helianthus annuus]|uniref:Uncharacterized protein n=1 Tax=Helianthus annuus TaxID=4232 RepID=A0A251UTC0_HELAN|nr:hypothetical protein HanXRQr2_Chr05g0231341 [Helianthus annuus]KAJ0923999.1 hypothetical protein HanPSC8_Chr05g0223181 [Helianthus annuus]
MRGLGAANEDNRDCSANSRFDNGRGFKQQVQEDLCVLWKSFWSFEKSSVLLLLNWEMNWLIGFHLFSYFG